MPIIVLLIIIGGLIFLSIVPSDSQGRSKTELIKKELDSLVSTIDDNNDTLRSKYIKLDTLLGKSLNKVFHNDSNVSTNLKSIRSQLSKSELNSIWEVHKIRNSIVHDNQDVDFERYNKSYKIYKQTIYKILKI